MSDNEPAGPVGVLVRQDPDAFDALRDTAADRLGVDPSAVEKDYWATEVLRSAVAPHDDVDQVVFKGGTSLSKAHGIIERFSEDIDLLVISRLTGKPLKRLLRAIADRASVELGVSHEREHEGRGYLNARDSYPARRDAGFLTSGVLLEMGSRGGPSPNEQRPIRSLTTPAGYETSVYVRLYSAYASTTAHPGNPTSRDRKSRNASLLLAIANTSSIAVVIQNAAGSPNHPPGTAAGMS